MQADILDALRRGESDAALTLAQAAVADAPDDPQSYRLLAMAQRATGDHVAALASIDRAIALAPDDADLHFHRAGYLVGARELGSAQDALAQSVQLDPNQLGAYVMQAQLALGRGDLDEAGRQSKLAARVDRDHPWAKMLEGTVALHRGDADTALTLLSKAAELAPEDAQVRYALGFAYMAKGHDAFAEQAFLGVLASTPDAGRLRGLIAELQRRQERFDEAAATLAPLLDAPGVTPGQLRFAGELELLAGRPERALPLLRRAFSAQPDDARLLAALFRTWHATGEREDARATLDGALTTTGGSTDLWRARVAVEPAGSDAALAVVSRWKQSAPGSIAALEIETAIHAVREDASALDAVAQQILALEPNHLAARGRLVGELLQRDAEQAVAYLDPLIEQSTEPSERALLKQWRTLAYDRVGRHGDALQVWLQRHADMRDRCIQPPAPTPAPHPWPAKAASAASMAPVAFLAGAPGSGVERVAMVLGAVVPRLLSDRFGSTPPNDALQRVDTPQRLAGGDMTSAEVAASWSSQLQARGIPGGPVIDWLLGWDNAWTTLLLEQLPQARALIVLRDPRDMLLHWLAFGAPMNLRVDSAVEAARWLAGHLEQVALLEELTPVTHSVIRLDALLGDVPGIVDALAKSLDGALPPANGVSLDAPCFDSGHWRDYAQVLAEPFALLTPVARRLGYPEA